MLDLIFYIFALLALISSVRVVTSGNPVYSVLNLIVAFLSTSVLFLILGAEFVAMVIIIVYVGAIAVLFLFVVMMLDIKIDKSVRSSNIYPLFAFVAIIILGLELFISFEYSHMKIFIGVIDTNMSNVEKIGNLMYTEYFYIFQLAGLVLLVAMVGAIVISCDKDHKSISCKQDVVEQLKRGRKEKTVKLVKIKSGEGVSDV